MFVMTSSVMATQVLMIVTISNNHQKVCGHYLACPYKYLKHVKLLVTIIRTCVAITELVITNM
jgi:hypothetical protein